MSKRTAKTYFVFNESICGAVHLGNNCDRYVRAKERKDYVKELVSEKNIVELTRYYRVSKHNKSFSRTFATV